MALDEPKNEDETFEIDGFTYLVNRQLLTEVQPITVDFKTFGFYITGGAAGCHSPCSC